MPLLSGLSGTKLAAGCVVSPRRSRTMSSYSTREMRRIGDHATVGVPGAHVAPKIDTPSAAGPPPSPPASTTPSAGDAASSCDEHAGASAATAAIASGPARMKSALERRIVG
jgi:hypothetical protein